MSTGSGFQFDGSHDRTAADRRPEDLIITAGLHHPACTIQTFAVIVSDPFATPGGISLMILARDTRSPEASALTPSIRSALLHGTPLDFGDKAWSERSLLG